MNKKQVQKRVLQNGKPLALSKFTWDEKTKTFSSNENYLIVDFTYIASCFVKTGSSSTVTTGSSSTVTTGRGSTVTTGRGSTVTTGSGSTVTTDPDSTVTTDPDSTVTTDRGSTVTTGSGSMVTTGSGSTVTTSWGSTVICDGENIIIINRNVFEVIQPEKGQTIHVCPHKISGHLVNGMLNGKPHIIADGILSEVTSHKGEVYKVINHGEEKQSYIIQRGNAYSHGATLKEAKEGLAYKFENRDLSAYEAFCS